MLAKSLFIWTTELIILIALLVQGGRAYLATTAHPSPSLSELTLPQNCPQPCWRGVQPGITVVEGKGQLPESDHYSVNYYTSDSGLVREISLYTLEPIRVGDLILRWGEPSHIVPYGTMFPDSDFNSGHIRIGTAYELYFYDSLVVAYTVVAEGNITPDHQVRAIRYYQPSEYGPPRRLESPVWQGFFIKYPIVYVAGGE